MRLNPSPVCSSPAFIAIPSYTCLVPPILSCVAGSEHMDHGTLPSAPPRPRIVCSDRYERPAAAERTRCARIAAVLSPYAHFLMTVALLPASSCTGQCRGRYASCAPPGSLAAAWLGKKCVSEHPTRFSCSTRYPSARRCLGCVCVLASSKIIIQSESLGGCERP